MLKAHALHSAAREVAGQIGPIEEALDQSFSRTANLLGFLPQARANSNLPLVTGHDAMMRLLASLNAIAVARGEMIAAHAAFADTGRDLRLPETGFGSLVPCPEKASLQVIETIAA